MHPLQEQLVTSFRIHESRNQVLLEKVSQQGLESTLSSRGGRTVGQQLVHCYQVRRDVLGKMRKDLTEGLPVLERSDGHDRDRLRAAFSASAAAIEQLIAEAPEDGSVKMFRGGLATFVAYLIAHESHHRGGAMLTLKQSKQSLDKDSYWRLWGWSKGS